MKLIIHILGFSIILISCSIGGNKKSANNIKASNSMVRCGHAGAYVTATSIVDMTSDSLMLDAEGSYFIPEGLRPTAMSKYNDDPVSSTAMVNYNVRIVADNSLNGDIDQDFNFDWTNPILKQLNTGIQLTNITSSVEYFALDRINTGGRVNTDNVIEELRKIIGADENDIIIALFNDTDFFNTANAIAINHGRGESKKHYIFGDGQLLLSPMILIHELGHCMGLTHSNEMVRSDCKMFNMMHESNIGCIMGFNARQLLLMNEYEYVDRLDSIRYYPNDSIPCFCDGMDPNYSSNIEEYLNSIDRNLDDTPLIGDFATMLDIDINDSTRKIDLRKNFDLEYKRFFGNTSSSTNYVNKRWSAHKKLMSNNRARLYIENARELSIYDTVTIADIVNGTAIGVALENSIDERLDCAANGSSCDVQLLCAKEKEVEYKNKIKGLSADLDDLKNVNGNLKKDKDALLAKIEKIEEMVQGEIKPDEIISTIQEIKKEIEVVNKKYKGYKMR